MNNCYESVGEKTTKKKQMKKWKEFKRKKKGKFSLKQTEPKKKKNLRNPETCKRFLCN